MDFSGYNENLKNYARNMTMQHAEGDDENLIMILIRKAR